MRWFGSAGILPASRQQNESGTAAGLVAGPSFIGACRTPALALEEAAADAVWEFSQVDQGQEVDGFEFAVDGWGAADTAGDFEVGAEEARRAVDFDGSTR
jgi:hypothetical protein